LNRLGKLLDGDVAAIVLALAGDHDSSGPAASLDVAAVWARVRGAHPAATHTTVEWRL
jgi:hypothetical protein